MWVPSSCSFLFFRTLYDDLNRDTNAKAVTFMYFSNHLSNHNGKGANPGY